MSEKSDSSTQIYVIAFALLVGAALVSASVFFSINSIAYQIGALDSTISSVQFGAAGSGSGAAAPAPVPTQAAPQPAPQPVANINTAGRPFLGGENAKVEVVEFSDFECPFCARAYPTIKQIESTYGDDVKIVYMHFPLTSLHPNAQKAAEASECANEQGKFWGYHDILFTTQRMDSASLKQYASDLGLDTANFNACLDGGEKRELVASHQQMGSGSGVSGTPTFFVNGQRLVGAQPFESFKALIDSQLAG